MQRKYLILCILELTLLHCFAYAQVGFQRKVFSPTFSTGVEFRTWEKNTADSTENITQYNFPMVFKVPLTEDIAFDIISLAITSSAKEHNLSGFRDIKARGVAMFADDTIMLNAGLNLPNGKNKLGSEETEVSLCLSDSALGFKYNRLGEGFDINLGCGVAKAVGAVALGAGVGYLRKGKYEYLEGKDSKYKHGNQFNFTGGFDLAFQPVFLRTDLTCTAYRADELNDSEVFKEGAKLTAEETFVLSTERLSLLMSARYTMRGKNKLLSNVVKEGNKRYGNQTNINGVIRLRLTDSFTLKGIAERLSISKEERKQNDAKVFGFGIGTTFYFMRMSYIDMTGKYYVGNSDQEKVELTGLVGTANLKLVF